MLLKKSTRVCTKHSIAKRISCHRLFPTMRVFTTTTSNVEIPKDIQEAMIVTKWKQVTLKEMRAPENKGRWQLVDAL